jgi:hypothetical protein
MIIKEGTTDKIMGKSSSENNIKLKESIRMSKFTENRIINQQ